MPCACAILSSVTCPALQYFTHYLINDIVFEKKKVIKYKMCFEFRYNLVSNISHSKKY